MIFKINLLIFYFSVFCFTVLVPSYSTAFFFLSPKKNYKIMTKEELSGYDYNITNKFLPKTFKLGVATSAPQIEGSWNQSGKSPSWMDNLFHEYNDQVVDQATTEVVCDSYKKYLEDVELVKDLKVDFYRFSIPWTRILPTGFTNHINWEAVDHYNNLINGLIAAGIEPSVTMIHFDEPQIFSDLGGWNQPKLIDYLVDYADLLFFLFGDRVKTWITINEPLAYCSLFPAMLLKDVKPFIAFGHTEYFCTHNFLKAHAKIYRLYEKKYKETQKGKISWTNPIMLSTTSNPTEDAELITRANEFIIGLYLHPLVHGDYPQVVIEAIANKSREQGFKESRLPKFTPQEIQEMKGTLDFVGVNFYGTYELGEVNDKDPSFYSDAGSSFTLVSGDIQTFAYRSVLIYLRDNYNNPEIVITETGIGPEPSLEDSFRTTYIQVYLSETIKAIEEDQINLTGFTYWTLMDDLEFWSGFTNTMGLYHVNFTDPNRTRTPRLSAEFYRKVSETRCVLDNCF